jgi:hypothetical protein
MNKSNSNSPLDLEEITFVYANDWYDYFLSGVIEYKGKRYYADCFDEIYTDKQRYRKFKVYDLGEALWAEEDKKHETFVKYVGTHFCFTEDSKGKARRDKNNSFIAAKHPDYMKFYEEYTSDKYSELINKIRESPVFGWFIY